MIAKKNHFVFVLITLFVISILFMNVNSHAQGVSINNMGNNPDNSAILDVSSTEKGFLIPRLSTTERNAITVPASSLLIYNSTTKCFEFYENGAWQALGCACIDPPSQPSAITGNSTPCENQTGLTYSVTYMQGVTYTWNLPSGWTQTAGGTTYFITVDAGTSSGNISVTPSNACGSGTAQTLAITVNTVPAVPTAGTHAPAATEIVWNWNTVSGATGYKWNTTNNYATATDKGTSTTHTETSLTCNTSYTRYVWAYNACGQSTTVLTLNSSTAACPFVCGGTLTINHVAGVVAPENKTVSYGTVSSTLGGTGAKCWITQNLGATNQASSATDNTEASAGWYWQFNRKQGYKVGPTPTWIITSISETSNWIAANDPCTIELGPGWRIPTKAEWENADVTGGWNNYTHTYASVLKLHAAGYLLRSDGSLFTRGTSGYYWSSTQGSDTNGWILSFGSSFSDMGSVNKAFGFSVRCLRD